jgi:SAM-dependent methyltransferase
MTDESEIAGKVRDGYDLIADQYMELVTETRASDPRPVWIDDLLRRLGPGSRVLDLGCGPGVPTATSFVDHGHLITGIDISPRQVEWARVNVPGGRFLVGDALEIEFEPGSFDAVVALFSLTHIPRDRWRSLFGRVGGWLRPGGWLLATLGTSDSPGFDEEDFLGFGHSNWTNGFAPGAIRTLLASVGFRAARSEVVEDELPSGIERWLWILGQFERGGELGSRGTGLPRYRSAAVPVCRGPGLSALVGGRRRGSVPRAAERR